MRQKLGSFAGLGCEKNSCKNECEWGEMRKVTEYQRNTNDSRRKYGFSLLPQQTPEQIRGKLPMNV